jgi:16S rRNA (guanine527-N7)-methyltransferase
VTARFDLPSDRSEPFGSLLETLRARVDVPTTITEPAQAADLHLADSLAGLTVPSLRDADRIADVGSGAGFPGLPLAIALPATTVDLIESVGRRHAVIEEMIAEVGLRNARAVRARAEEWGAGEGRERYAAVTARAIAPLAVLVEYAAPLLRRGGALVAWKGARDADEEAAGASAAERVGLSLDGVLSVKPFEAARHRHLHVYRKLAPTPEGFPRRPGMAAKKPLA